MAGYNRIIIMGNLTRDPDYKQLNSGQTLCRLGIAANRPYRNKQTGEMTQEVCFVDVDVWGAQAETCRQYLSKGKPVLVEGRLKLDSWQDQEGKNRSKHTIVSDRVVFLPSNNVSEVETAGEDMQSRSQEEALAHVRSLAAQGAENSFAGATKDDAPKTRKKRAAEPAADVPVIEEPPFQDDLPF